MRTYVFNCLIMRLLCLFFKHCFDNPPPFLDRLSRQGMWRPSSVASVISVNLLCLRSIWSFARVSSPPAARFGAFLHARASDNVVPNVTC